MKKAAAVLGILSLGIVLAAGPAFANSCTTAKNDGTCSMETKDAKGVAAAAPAKVSYTCPMHPEVQSAQPGKCPKCGMFLAKKEIKTAKAGAYTCPMHPEVTGGKKDKCPECGMKLQKKAAAAKMAPQCH